jgi:hypothetical protein
MPIEKCLTKNFSSGGVALMSVKTYSILNKLNFKNATFYNNTCYV